ncbi:uncharacterized protein LOC112341878 [Selaginella moellendorffii]|uniref:uncharacterized protein LOC112341878 n=1 Tax=Selaginella moellendorffii TaxID=88036 RepID=UPI000D1D07C6|nr:uncharacterized protein LOC112341878 [Selaginella moellendorffii]XP_024518584.1 uncharacterized protein LOC112341878 [Selaginella moellendorffii]XP_024518585.1 uncharacterized protein LOC112341878 [Selaginella moellendorffii]|eukprot:XP_024518583.1 uncharacterized protein LOC112341878 [Selaginella moellendorffii]
MGTLVATIVAPSALAPRATASKICCCAGSVDSSNAACLRSDSSVDSRSGGGDLRFRTAFLPSISVKKNISVRRQRSRARLGVRAIALKQLELGAPPPDFELGEPATGKEWCLKDFQQYPALLVMFISYRCPFVVFLRSALIQLVEEYMEKGLGVVAISPNSVVVFPEDGPAEMQEEVEKYGYKFPYLYDETQEVTQAYAPLGTPDFFVFRKNEEQKFELAYHGQFDDARDHNPNKIPITGRDLRLALDAVLTGKPVDPHQKHSMGCAIQWHPHLIPKLYPKPKLEKDDTNLLWHA